MFVAWGDAKANVPFATGVISSADSGTGLIRQPRSARKKAPCRRMRGRTGGTETFDRPLLGR